MQVYLAVLFKMCLCEVKGTRWSRGRVSSSTTWFRERPYQTVSRALELKWPFFCCFRLEWMADPVDPCISLWLARSPPLGRAEPLARLCPDMEAILKKGQLWAGNSLYSQQLDNVYSNPDKSVEVGTCIRYLDPFQWYPVQVSRKQDVRGFIHFQYSHTCLYIYWTCLK